MSLILEWIQKLRPQRVLEIGCASGHLLEQLAESGCRAHGIDISPGAREHLAQRFRGRTNPTFEICDFDQVQETFDAVLAFEVLEHIEDDDGTVRRWKELITPGGHLFLSVPAHARQWTSHDEAAGHFRRYEREPLRALLERHEMRVVCMNCYGYPLANLLAPLNLLAHRDWRKIKTAADRTKHSGISRNVAHRLRWFCNPATMWPWCQIQRLFFNTELGNGYFVVAQRKVEADRI